MKGWLRVGLVGIVAGGALGYGTIVNEAHASSTITLQLQLTIRCTSGLQGTGPEATRNCDDEGATLDGSFAGTSGIHQFAPSNGASCNEPWFLDQENGTSGGPDGLYGQITCTGPGSTPQVSVTGGYGRFAGYTAPPTPQPTFAYADVNTGPFVPVLPVLNTAPCNARMGPQFTCPETGNGTGLVTLTLTSP